MGTIFGSTLLVSRLGISQFHPTTFVGLRMLIAVSIYGLVYVLRIGNRKIPRDRNLWKHGILFGIFGTAVPITFIISSLIYQSSGVTSLLMTTSPAMTVLIANYLLPDERLSIKKVVGVLLALGGAALLAIRGETGLPDVHQASIIGYGLALTGILTGSVALVFARRNLRLYHAFEVASIRMITAMLVVVPISIMLVGVDFSHVDRIGWLSLLFTGIIGTFFGFFLEFYIVKRFGATPAVMAGYVVPIIATLGGWLFLNEVVTLGMLGVMVMILSGITLVNQG
jgi:drug/metabolite transporter (DMT)-like permease